MTLVSGLIKWYISSWFVFLFVLKSKWKCHSSGVGFIHFTFPFCHMNPLRYREKSQSNFYSFIYSIFKCNTTRFSRDHSSSLWIFIFFYLWYGVMFLATISRHCWYYIDEFLWSLALNSLIRITLCSFIFLDDLISYQIPNFHPGTSHKSQKKFLVG